MKEYDAKMYRKTRYGVIGLACNLPTAAGEKTTIGLYRIAQKLVKFN